MIHGPRPVITRVAPTPGCGWFSLALLSDARIEHLFGLEVPMREAHARTDLDQVIWADYVRLRNQAEVGELHGMPQRTVSDAIARYLDAIPESEKREHRVRTLDRFERVYQAWKDKADTSTRAANVVIRTLALQMRLLGLEPKELHISGQVEYEHHVEHEPGPTMEELLERWRAEGTLRTLPTVELRRLDGGG